MRTIIWGLLSIVMVLASDNCYAQSSKEQRKERQELAKASKKELNEKASKAARKEAKRLSKEGWKTAPGALPLEKQLDSYRPTNRGFSHCPIKVGRQRRSPRQYMQSKNPVASLAASLRFTPNASPTVHYRIKHALKAY